MQIPILTDIVIILGLSRIEQDDVLYLFGRADGIQKLNKFLKLEI